MRSGDASVGTRLFPQHYAHHAISIKNKPYHTGFFFKLWDQLFGSTWTGVHCSADGRMCAHALCLADRCFCAKCERDAGRRSEDAWAKVRGAQVCVSSSS